MLNKISIKRFFIVGCLSAVFAMGSVGITWADDEHENEDGCKDCGVVTAIQVTETGASGVGAAAGALAGGLIGNQVGQTATAGSTIGGTATTLLGLAGGAIGGHYAEQAVTASKSWTVAITMSDGNKRSIVMNTEPKVKVGAQVRLQGDSISNIAPESDQEEHD